MTHEKSVAIIGGKYVEIPMIQFISQQLTKILAGIFGLSLAIALRDRSELASDVKEKIS